MLGCCARRFGQFHCWGTQANTIFVVVAASRGEMRLTVLANAQVPLKLLSSARQKLFWRSKFRLVLNPDSHWTLQTQEKFWDG